MNIYVLNVFWSNFLLFNELKEVLYVILVNGVNCFILNKCKIKEVRWLIFFYLIYFVFEIILKCKLYFIIKFFFLLKFLKF